MPRKNLLQAFQKTARRLRHRPCFRYKEAGRWKTLSWIQVEDRARDLALGLKALGVNEGDRVALVSKTRFEWTLCDLAILSLGAVTVPIYPSSTADQVGYILENCGARAVIVEDEGQIRKIRSVRKRLSSLKTLIVISGSGGRETLTLEDLEKKGRRGDEAAWLRGIGDILPTDTATIVYTSGTTGPPKGAVLTHGNFLSEGEALMQLSDLSERHVALLFLPLAHIFARAMQFWQFEAGFTQAYAQGLETVVADLGKIRPQFFASVPRVFEKIYEGIVGSMATASPFKRWILFTVGRPFICRRIRRLFGGRLRFAISGGAPFSPEIAKYFHRAGVLIVEGYGLTETTAGVFINSEDNFRFGMVGRALRGVRAKIARDGEILIKAPMIFQGYYKDPQATARVFTRDGWFKTGDIGEIDAEGFLKITDRKKDIIVTAAGKNIAPQNIENFLKTVPIISQVMVHGDRRKYLTALVTLNRPAVKDSLERQGIRLNGHSSLARHPSVRRLMTDAIAEKNRLMASYETIKRFAILEEDFSQERGELTPTLKLKRKFVGEKYKDVIEGLYR